jgi:cytochrome c biogenesis protein ResB
VRSNAAEQVDKRGVTLYTDRKMMLLLMDKIVDFDRTVKMRRNPTIADTTLAEEDPTVIEAVKANKKKGKGKGNVADTNVAATFVATTPRPSTKQCKFCDKARHVESEYYTKQNLEKFRHKMVSAVTVEQEPTVS